MEGTLVSPFSGILALLQHLHRVSANTLYLTKCNRIHVRKYAAKANELVHQSEYVKSPCWISSHSPSAPNVPNTTQSESECQKLNFLGRYPAHAAPPKKAMPITCIGTTPKAKLMCVCQSPASHPEFSSAKSKTRRNAPIFSAQ